VRAAKMNAVDSAMFEALVETGRSLAADRGLRAVVLSGEGRAFCAGLDVASMMGGAGGRNVMKSDPDRITSYAQDAAWVWHELPVPVIAAVHGVAYGAGIQLALAADIRFVTPDARLSVREIHWGLIPDVTGTQTLRHLVGLDVAKELTFTGRVVSGTEAAALGLATHLSDTPREAAFELAAEIAGRSPTAVRAAKELLNASVTGSEDDGLKNEARLQKTLLGSPNMIESVRANMDKRAPDFEDPK